MIKFEHSVFALPFAYMGMMLASDGRPTFHDFLWITVAMVGARTSAMTINRLADAKIDEANPRTSTRAIPAGLLQKKEAILYMVLSFAIFLIAVYQLAPICRYLWPFVVAPFIIYPYTKRFTWLCHFWMGLSLGVAPIAAWIAVTNGLAWQILLLGLAVMVWSAGFDILYATQDIDHDRKEHLFSLPAKFGIPGSLLAAKFLHIAAIALLVGLGLAFSLGVVYYLGLIVVAGLLAYENLIVKADDLSRLNAAFFTMNGTISFVAFISTSLSLTVGG